MTRPVGLRPLLHLGRQEAARHKGRTALVALLIGFPVFALCAALVLARSFDRSESSTAALGRATDMVTVESATAAAGSPTPDGSRKVVLRASSVFTSTRADGSGPVRSWNALDGPVSDPMLAGHLVRLSGRLPVRPDEMALTPKAADALHVSMGDSLLLAVPKVRLRVVGFAGQADCGGCADMFLPTGAVPADYGTPASAGIEQSANGTQYQVFLETPGAPVVEDRSVVNGRTSAELVAYVVAVFGTIWTGLVAATALSVGARRRRRELGLLATNGADPARLRLAVVAEALVVGGAASLVAAVAGTLLGAASLTTVQGWVGNWGATLVIPWVWIVLAPLVGVLGAVGAALAGARAVARSSVADLLSGRGVPSPPPRRWMAGGIVLGVAGLGILAIPVNGSVPAGPRVYLLLIGGLVAVAGLVGISVALVGSMGAIRGPGPATRIVGRDLSRHGSRGRGCCRRPGADHRPVGGVRDAVPPFRGLDRVAELGADRRRRPHPRGHRPRS